MRSATRYNQNSTYTIKCVNKIVIKTILADDYIYIYSQITRHFFNYFMSLYKIKLYNII